MCNIKKIRQSRTEDLAFSENAWLRAAHVSISPARLSLHLAKFQFLAVGASFAFYHLAREANLRLCLPNG
jgi:hypothetical protein